MICSRAAVLPKRILSWQLFAVMFLSIIVGGCGSGGPAMAPVSGTVTLKGKPVTKGTIIFESSGNRPSTGKIQDGKIVEVTTFETGDGVPIGSHNVAINITAEASSAVVANPGETAARDRNYMGGASLIPAKFGDPTTSGLKADVVAGENELKFDIIP